MKSAAEAAEEYCEQNNLPYGGTEGGGDYARAFLAGYAFRDKDVRELVEALRKSILWAESVYGRLVAANGLREYDIINWNALNEAREALAKFKAREG
jgi:hypothetical protein